MGIQLRLFILYALFWNMMLGHGVRDEWRQLGSFDLEAHLISSLASANLSDQERGQIYRLIDDKTIHDSFTDDQRDKERETVLSARVGLISLTDGQSQQIVVRGPAIHLRAQLELLDIDPGPRQGWLVAPHTPNRWRLSLLARPRIGGFTI